MKKLFFILTLVLLVGCTLQENELDQVLLELENMAGELSQLEGYASVHNFDGFKQRVISANASLEKINAWVVKAEERGEDPEIISRVRSDSVFLETQFKTLVLMADLLKKLEDSKPLMEALKRKQVDKLDSAITAVDDILELIDNTKESISETERAAGNVVDTDILDTKGTLEKMYAFENEVDLRRNEFVSVKSQLENVKENLSPKQL